LAEAHRRLAAPLICFSAVALALLAVLGGSYSRQGYGARISWAFGGLIVVLLSVTGFMPTIANQPALSVLLYLIPLLVLFFATKNMRVAMPRLAPSLPKTPVGIKHKRPVSNAV